MEPYTITIIVLASLVLLSWVLFLVVLHYVKHRKLPKMVMRMRQKKDPCYRCKRARKYVCDGCYVQDYRSGEYRRYRRGAYSGGIK